MAKTFKIRLSTGWSDRDMYRGLTENEAIEICESYNWQYMDENCFVWSMDYVEE